LTWLFCLILYLIFVYLFNFLRLVIDWKTCLSFYDFLEYSQTAINWWGFIISPLLFPGWVIITILDGLFNDAEK